ncbi:OmpA family protein [Alphaproteobacteria bacterium]|jgi:chemotaxis protein MotB|nr:OmpA family protein [Alphaproteobacteria bacterium]
MAEAVEEEPLEAPEEECPKCPPVGAPAWMATFADMATLLMAFFVLILSFAEFNIPKFKLISGSLQNAFGVQRTVPVIEQPMGTTVLSLSFSPSPAPSVTDNMSQQTTQTTQPNLEIESKKEDAQGGENEAGDSGGGDQATNELVETLKEAIARGDIEIETMGKDVVVNFTTTEAPEADLPALLQQTLNAIEEIKKSTGTADPEELFGGIEKKLEQLAQTMADNQSEQGGEGDTGNKLSKGEQVEQAIIAEDELKVALKQEIGQGLVDVQREKDRVIITVGSGGAFGSGSAVLTPNALKIMDQIAGVNAEGSSRINVSGHTDDVPMLFGAQYRDNWDLAAARASSVVQALEKTGKVNGQRMQAVSFGESKPLAPNDTAAGRNKNRRIEIEINY